MVQAGGGQGEEEAGLHPHAAIPGLDNNDWSVNYSFFFKKKKGVKDKTGHSKSPSSFLFALFPAGQRERCERGREYAKLVGGREGGQRKIFILLPLLRCLTVLCPFRNC